MDIEFLSGAFAKHVETCLSAPILCRINTAFESWFRVELVIGLVYSGIPAEQVVFRYFYSDKGGNADLFVEAPDFKTVFELKSFVKGADAKKLTDFPNQLKRIESEVNKRLVTQGVAFCTFFDYSEDELNRLMDHFFHGSWRKLPVRYLVEGFPLKFTLASFALSC